MTQLHPDLVGHRQVQADLLHALRQQRLAHAHILAGPAGIGKRMLAEGLARALVCEQRRDDGSACHECHQCRMVEKGVHADVRVFERDKSTFSVELMREGVLDWASRKPREGRVKAGILDGAEYLGVQAANAFLKTLEEPPPGTYWILITSAAGATLPTIASRCRVVNVSPLTRDELEALAQGRLASAIDTALRERDARRAALARTSKRPATHEHMADGDDSGDAEDGDNTPSLSPAEWAFVLDAADDSPGRLLEAIREDFLAQREWAAALVRDGSKADPIAAADNLLALLERKGDETQEPMRERLRSALALAQCYLRDIAVLQRGARQRAMPSVGHSAELARLSRGICVNGVMSAIGAIERLSGAIEGNVSIRLVVTNAALCLCNIPRQELATA